MDWVNIRFRLWMQFFAVFQTVFRCLSFELHGASLPVSLGCFQCVRTSAGAQREGSHDSSWFQHKEPGNDDMSKMSPKGQNLNVEKCRKMSKREKFRKRSKCRNSWFSLGFPLVFRLNLPDSYSVLNWQRIQATSWPHACFWQSLLTSVAAGTWMCWDSIIFHQALLIRTSWHILPQTGNVVSSVGSSMSIVSIVSVSDPGLNISP